MLSTVSYVTSGSLMEVNKGPAMTQLSSSLFYFVYPMSCKIGKVPITVPKFKEKNWGMVADDCTIALMWYKWTYGI